MRKTYPEIPIQIHDGLASVDVDELAIDGEWDTLLGLHNIFADEFASDVCSRALSARSLVVLNS